MNRLILSVCLLATTLIANAQTLLIDPALEGGFELGSTLAANGWTATNNTTDGWIVGSAATPPTGANCAHVSSNGTNYAYSKTSSYVHLYKDIVVPAGEPKLTLTFDWKCNSEYPSSSTSDWDNLKVFLVPSTATFDTSSNPSGTQLVGPNALPGGNGNYNSATATWNTETIQFGAVPGQAYKLVFVFKSDISNTTGSPAAIDNVSLTSSPAGTFISVQTGNWNDPSTWQANAVPNQFDSAVVSAGHTVTVNAANLGILNLLVDGTLTYSSTPTSFKVNNNLHISNSGIVNVFSGTTGKTLDVGGNIYNDGILDVSVGSTTAGTLTLSGANVQTVTGTGSFGTKIRNLNITNTSGAFPTINWQVNNVVVEYNLTITNQKINLNGNTLQYGNSTTAGNTFSFTNGGFYNGTFSRWWASGTTGYTTTTAITATPISAAGRYPFINSLGEGRIFYLGRTTPSGTGTYDVTYYDATTHTTGLSVVDGLMTITDRWDGNFKVTTTGAPSAATYQVSIFAPNAISALSEAPYIMLQNSAISGTHIGGFVNLGTRRTGVSHANLTDANGIYLGYSDAMKLKVSVASGDWNNPATWSDGIVPACLSNVQIMSGHTVTVSSAGNVSKSIIIQSGGTLVVNSGDLVVGCVDNNTYFTNNGILTVAGGTLTVNGQMTHSSGSTFNQSGGEIFIDPNSGAVATSLAANILVLNTNNLNWTGGRITIVDPSPSTTSYYALIYSNSNNVNLTNGTHTFRLGNGVSNQAGGNSNGFYLNTWSSSGRLLFRNLEIDALNGTNRHVTTAYSFGVDSNFTIHSNSEVRLATLYVGGNILNNGIFKSTTSLYLSKFISGTVSNSPYPQVVSGTGTFQNVTSGTPTANLYNLYFYNSSTAGVTLQVPLSVSSTLNFTSGIVHTSPTSILKLGTTTATGTLNGGSNTAYVDGPFQVTFASGNTLEKFIPLGTATEYAPIYLTLATSAISVVQTQAINDPSGTFPASLGAISNIKWNIAGVSGNITSYLPKVAHAGIASLSKLLSSTSVGGFYDNTVIGTNSSYVGGTLPSLAPFSAILNANFQNYLTYGFPVNCSGVPTPGSLNLSDPEICSNKQTTISISPIDGKMGYSYEWESSVDNITYTTIASAIDTILNVFPTGQYIRAKITCQFEPTPGYSAPIKLDNSFIVNPIADIVKCGPGTVTLTATGNSGSIFWFEDATNFQITNTGSPYTFTVNNDTTVYVRSGYSQTGSVVIGTGSTTTGSSYANANIFYGLYGSYKSQSVILASELTAAGLSAGMDINTLSLHTGNVPAGASYSNFSLRFGHTNSNVATSTFVTSSTLTTVYSGTLALTSNTANTITFGTGAPNSYFTWDGVSNIIIESSWTNGGSSATTSELKVDATSFISTAYNRLDNQTPSNIEAVTATYSTVSYRPMFTLGYNNTCFSTAEDVNVDITPAPVLTIDNTLDSICIGSSVMVNLTSNPTDYDTYTWSSSATGDEINGWEIIPSTSGVYTLTAEQTSGSMCSNVATINIDVQTAIPNAPVSTPASYDICEGATTAILSVNSVLTDSVVVNSGALNLTINASNAIHNTSLVVSGIPAGATITELSVTMNMTHTYLGDMVFTLNSPNGNGVIIFDQEGGGSDNLVNTIISSNGTTSLSSGSGPYNGVYAPSFSMAPLMTGNLNGTWVLNIEDVYPSLDHGTFQNWSIKIKYQTTNSISWYDAATNGNLLGTGSTLETIGSALISNPAIAGTYNFYAVSTFGKCNSSAAQIPVEVHALPMVIAGSDLNVCNAEEVTLTASGNAVSYTWNNGVIDGTPFYATAGNYVVTGTSAFGCTAKDSLIITTLPSPIVTAGPDVAECYGTQVAFNASGNATSYTWNNGVIDGQAFSLINGGYYVVTGQGANGCFAKDSLFATVHALPLVDAGADITTCENSSITLSGSGADTYTWDNGVTDGVAFVQPVGTVTYIVIGTDANGCSNSDDINVTVNPLTTLTADPDFAVCEGVEAEISVTVANETNGSWITNGLGTIAPDLDAHQITYTPAPGESGDIYFVYTAVGVCNTELDSVIVTINENPVVDLGADIVTTDATYVLDATSAFTTYTWSTGETTQTITVSQTGSYSVVVTDANGCSGTDTISFITTFSVENLDGSKGSIDVFPNPTREIVNLQFNDVKANEVRIDVVNMSGAVISSSKASLVEGNGLVVLNLGNVAEGVYIVRMSYNNSVSTHRIVVHK